MFDSIWEEIKKLFGNKTPQDLPPLPPDEEEARRKFLEKFNSNHNIDHFNGI